jgi:hypothetical protein
MYGGKNGNFLEGCWELRIQQFNWLATLPPERKTFLEKQKAYIREEREPARLEEVFHDLLSGVFVGVQRGV